MFSFNNGSTSSSSSVETLLPGEEEGDDDNDDDADDDDGGKSRSLKRCIKAIGTHTHTCRLLSLSHRQGGAKSGGPCFGSGTGSLVPLGSVVEDGLVSLSDMRAPLSRSMTLALISDDMSVQRKGRAG